MAVILRSWPGRCVCGALPDVSPLTLSASLRSSAASAGMTTLPVMNGELSRSLFPGGLACGPCTVGSGFGWKYRDGVAVSDLRTAGSAAEGGQRAVVDEAWVVRRARELLAEGDPRYAREIVRNALDTLGRQADLLWLLADVEFAAGDLIRGESTWMRRSPRVPTIRPR